MGSIQGLDGALLLDHLVDYMGHDTCIIWAGYSVDSKSFIRLNTPTGYFTKGYSLKGLPGLHAAPTHHANDAGAALEEHNTICSVWSPGAMQQDSPMGTSEEGRGRGQRWETKPVSDLGSPWGRTVSLFLEALCKMHPFSPATPTAALSDSPLHVCDVSAFYQESEQTLYPQRPKVSAQFQDCTKQTCLQIVSTPQELV